MDLSGIEWSGFWTAAGALGSIAGAVIAYLTGFRRGHSKAVHDIVEEDILINGSLKTRYNYYAEQLDQQIETIRLSRKLGIEVLVIGAALAAAWIVVEVVFEFELEGFFGEISSWFASGMTAVLALMVAFAAVSVKAVKAGARYRVLVATLGAELDDVEGGPRQKESDSD
ncbi:hypothetical protein [Nocardiopsis coralliicola]